MIPSTPRLRLFCILPIALLMLLASSATAVEQTVGLLSYDESLSFNGYTLFEARQNPEIFLIDNYGRTVHTWDMQYTNSSDLYLMPDGKLIRGAKVIDSLGNIDRTLQIIAWDGTVEWSFDYQGETYTQHHDIEPMPNGNVLILANQRLTLQEAIALGFDSASVGVGGVKVDYVAEVEPTGVNGGNIVWEWHILDHLVQNNNINLDNYGDPSAHPELIDADWHLGSYTDWTHANSIAYNPELDQIAVCSRTWGEVWIIDHSTTKAEAAGHTGGNSGMGGDIIYRWGNPQTYGAGTADDQQLWGPHDIHWIEPGIPGEGNLMIYNNGWNRPEGQFSTVVELETTVDHSGQYPHPADGAAHGPGGFAWSYGSNSPETFFSATISGAHRLPNGNTMVCVGRPGLLFEVTEDGSVVWEYQNPVIAAGPVDQGVPTSPSGMQVFRCSRYAPDHAAFDGRELTPGPPVEGYSISISETDHMPTEPLDTDSVLVTSRIVLEADVFLREANLVVHAGDSSFSVTMYDDGTNGDIMANDSVFAAWIPALAPQTEVSYYISAEDDKSILVFDPTYADQNSVFYTYTVNVEFICGDINGDGSGPNVSDLTYLVEYLFSGGAQPPNMGAADVNGDGSGPDITDLTYMVAFLFSAGDPLNCP